MNQHGLTDKQKNALRVAIPGIATAGNGDAADIIDGLYNLGGKVISYTSNATANTADTVTHNLGYVPNGYLVVKNGNGGVVYDGGASNTANTLSLKCTVASNTVTLIVF